MRMSQDGIQLRALVISVIDLRLLQEAEPFL
jgi:hypothetical protein